ncbi:MAG: hypothetical protein JWN86_472 [Planctomycetota bacterium]|nr:hypothetical protein [Planctomycetota bacterium]
MDQAPFHYQPKCSVTGCERPGLFKVAAPWTYGNIRELKNYGLCCDLHRESLFNRAKVQAESTRLSEGETVGPVGLYQMAPGVRDAGLTRLE